MKIRNQLRLTPTLSMWRGRRIGLLCLYVMFFLASCQSVQTVKSVEAEKQRTETAIEIISQSNLSKPEKKILITEFRAKDRIIESQSNDVTNAQGKVEQIQKKNVSMAIEVGYGRVLKWIIFFVIGGTLLFIAFKIAKRFAWL
jgi:hypothetical protein